MLCYRSEEETGGAASGRPARLLTLPNSYRGMGPGAPSENQKSGQPGHRGYGTDDGCPYHQETPQAVGALIPLSRSLYQFRL